MTAAAELFIRIGADVNDFIKDMNRAGSSLGDVFKGTLGAELAADAIRAVGSAVVDFARDSVAHLGEVEQLMAQTTAVINSTGGAAGITATQISDLANSIEAATGVSGEMIQKGENLLLTFTNVKNVAGAGNDVFTQTTRIMADMSVALGQDASASAMQLGKALNDPIKGVSALQRVGVSFTESQKDSIKSLVEHGKTLEAQKVILAELGKEFRGSADAFGKTWPGVLAKAEASWENLGDALLGPLMPAFKAGMATLADTVNGLAGALGDPGLLASLNAAFGPTTKAIIVGLGAAIAVGLVSSVLATLPAIGLMASAWLASASAMAVALWPVIATAAAVAFAARPIIKYWDQIPAAFSAIFGLAEATVISWYMTVRTVAMNISKAFYTVASNIASYMNDAFGGIGQELQAQWNNLPASVRGPLAGVANAFKGMSIEIGSAAAAWPGTVLGAVKRVGSAYAGVWAPIGAEISTAFQIGKTAVNDLGKYINGFAGEATKSFGKVADAGDAMGGKAAKGAKKTGDAAKAAAAAAKAAAQEVAQAMEHIAGGLRSIVDLTTFAKFPAIVMRLSDALVGVEAHAQGAAAGFDEWGAKAKMLDGALKDLAKVGVSKESGLYKRIAGDLDVATRASERFQARQKSLGDVFNTLSASIAGNEVKARVLGTTFNRLDADIQATTTALNAAMEATVVDADAIAFLKGQLDGLNAQVPPAVSGFDSFKASMQGTAQAASLMREGIATIGAALGATFLDPILSAVTGVMDFGLAIVQVIAAAPEVVKGVTAMVDAVNLSLGPWGWALAAVGLVTAGLYKLGGTSSETAKLYDADIEAMAKATVGSGNVIVDAWNAAGEGIMKVARAMRSAIDWMLAPSAANQLAIDEMASALQTAKNKQKAWTEEVTRTRKAIDDTKASMASGLSSSFSSSIKGFLDGTKGMAEGLRTGVRDAITSGIIDGFLKRGAIESMLGPLLDKLSTQMQSGTPAELAGTIAAIGKKVPQIAASLESVFSPLKATLDKAFNTGGDKVAGILAARTKAIADIGFKQNTLGSLDATGAMRERVTATEKALTDLREAGQSASNQFGDLVRDLEKTRAALADLTATTKSDTKEADANAKALAEAYAPGIKGLQGQLASMLDSGGQGSQAYKDTLSRLQGLQALAGTGPTAAGAPVAVSAAAYGAVAAGGGTGSTTNYTTLAIRVDSRDAGEAIVKQLQRLGIRVT